MPVESADTAGGSCSQGGCSSSNRQGDACAAGVLMWGMVGQGRMAGSGSLGRRVSLVGYRIQWVFVVVEGPAGRLLGMRWEGPEIIF